MDIKFHCSESSNFKNENQSVRAFTYKDYYIDLHSHDFYEMNIVLGGTGIHHIKDSSFAVERGDVFVIPPTTPHAYDTSDRLEVYHVLLKKDFIKKNEVEARGVPGYLQFMELAPFLRQSGTESMFLKLTAKQTDEILQELKSIEDGGEFDKSDLCAIANHTAWRVIYRLSYLLDGQNRSEPTGVESKYRRQMLDTLEYINLNLSKRITVESLAAMVYLSRSTFLRNFRLVCGCSPTEYLVRYRVKKALELLESGNMSKTEVAHLTGFYDLSHMERCIKNQKNGQ